MKLIFIGAGSLAEKIYRKLKLLNKDFELKIILDNSIAKQGSMFLDTLVDSIENIKLYYNHGDKILVTSSYYKGIIPQLKGLGIIEFDIYKEFEQKLDEEILSKNLNLNDNKFKNRVFLVGNGPSLNNLDLKHLENEDTIMVSHFYKSETLLSLNPNFWLVADPGFWNEKLGFLNTIEQTLKERLPQTKFLINIEATYSKKFNQLYNYKNTFLYSLDYENDKVFEVLDFCDRIPCFSQNVMSIAIMLAIHLKYEEIYLIGCDHSWWGYTKDEIDAGKIPKHLYIDDDKVKNINKNVFKEYGYEGILQTIERQKFEYNSLGLIANKNKIKIFNATLGGELEIFPRVNFNRLFNRNNNELL